MERSEEQLHRIKIFLEFHLGKNYASLSNSQKLELLEKKKKRLLFLLVINVLGAVFFGYWFLAGITSMGKIWLYVIGGVFLLNMFALNAQKNQLGDALVYIRESESRI